MEAAEAAEAVMEAEAAEAAGAIEAAEAAEAARLKLRLKLKLPPDLPAAILCTSGTALPKVKLKPEVMVAGTQVDQEERVMGDTPPARLGCNLPVLEAEFSACLEGEV